MMPRFLLIIVLALASLWATPAFADKFSDSYLSMKVNGGTIDGRWDIAIRDLDAAVGVDRDGNGAVTWGEIRARHAAIAAYALSRLHIATAGHACPLQAGQQLIDHHSDGAYSVLLFHAVCPLPVKTLEVHYGLLFDIDPQHKGLLKLEGNGVTSTAIFGPDTATQQFKLEKISRASQFTEYLIVGIHHIWSGFDHLLFLFSLLLPAVLTFTGKRWEPENNFRMSLTDVLKIVTAFTVAHSITLTLATLHVVSLPSRWVESGIAASVVIAALNNLFPIVEGRRWIAAFAFGLIHGFGFASVLTDLGLPRASLLIALVGFNLGVEVGQLSIVALFMPIAYALRGTWFYKRMVFTTGSAIIVLIASVWLFERAFDVKLVSL